MDRLRVEHLEVRYGDLVGVADVSLDVQPGSIVALLGSNGAGKTTTLNAIAGLVRPSGGTIEWRGEAIGGEPAYAIVAKGLALSPEGWRLFVTQTVEQNLRLGATALSDKGRLSALFERVYALFPRLAERRKQLAGTLSGGERQMVALGRALMSEPTLLMLDEPSLGLAPTVVDQLYDALYKLHEEGLTLLLAEQSIPLALAIADYAYVLQTGRTVLEGTAESLENNAQVQEIYLGIKAGGGVPPLVPQVGRPPPAKKRRTPGPAPQSGGRPTPQKPKKKKQAHRTPPKTPTQKKPPPPQTPPFFLKIARREHRHVADAAVGAAGVVAGRGETLLHLLHFGERRRAFAVRERLDERPAAKHAVAEMHDRQHVVVRRIVALDRVEVRPEQERRPARDRHPQFRGEIRLRKRLAVRTRHAQRLPCLIAARRFVRRLAGRAHLVAPVLAAPVFAAIDQIARARAERVVRPAERIDLAVAVIVETDVEPDFRHPLAVAHRAGPGADHLLRFAPALLHDAHRIDQLGLPIGAPARLAPGERRERRKHRARVVLLHDRIAEGRSRCPTGRG